MVNRMIYFEQRVNLMSCFKTLSLEKIHISVRTEVLAVWGSEVTRIGSVYTN